MPIARHFTLFRCWKRWCGAGFSCSLLELCALRSAKRRIPFSLKQRPPPKCPGLEPLRYPRCPSLLIPQIPFVVNPWSFSSIMPTSFNYHLLVVGRVPWETDSKLRFVFMKLIVKWSQEQHLLGKMPWLERAVEPWCTHNKGFSQSHGKQWSWDGSIEMSSKKEKRPFYYSLDPSLNAEQPRKQI